MFIAQHSVAGEGELHPEQTPAPTSATDQSALDEFLAGQSNLPWVVFRAAHRAASIPTLTARARSVLAALARTVDAHRPYAAIFARRELLTGRAMQSMRTFYRSLDDLERAGFIDRAPQKRYGEAGLFGRAYLHLTQRAATTLGYVEAEQTQKPATPNSETQGLVSDATSPTLEMAVQDFAMPCVTVADGAIYKDLFPKNQKRQPASLPADLERLLSLGFHRFLIFKLMREAKNHAKRLSDVVEATWDHLRLAKHPISYLQKLLNSPVDFNHQVNAKLAKREAETAKLSEARRIDAIVRNCAGKQYLDQSGGRLVQVSATSDTLMVKIRGEQGLRTATQNWQAGFVGALLAGKLVEATEVSAAPVSNSAVVENTRDLHRESRATRAIEATLVKVKVEKDMQRTLTPDIQDRLSEMRAILRVTRFGGRAALPK
jgi:hypothetical protein